MTAIDFTPGNVKKAMEAGKSSDLWKIHPKHLRVMPDFNQRDVTQAYHDHVASLVEEINKVGYRQDMPMTGYIGRDGDDHVVYVVNGHHRLAACMQLYEAGKWDDSWTVTVITRKFDSAWQLYGDIIKTNSGKYSTGSRDITPHEAARVAEKMVAAGATIKQVAEHFGVTRVAIDDMLILRKAPAALIDLVVSEHAASNLVIQEMKRNAEEAEPRIMAGLALAHAQGKTRVTPKHVKAAAEVALPEDAPDSTESAGEDPPVELATVRSADSIQSALRTIDPESEYADALRWVLGAERMYENG